MLLCPGKIVNIKLEYCVYSRNLSRGRAEIFFDVYFFGGCPFMSATSDIYIFIFTSIRITIFVSYRNCCDICFIIDQIIRRFIAENTCSVICVHFASFDYGGRLSDGLQSMSFRNMCFP